MFYVSIPKPYAHFNNFLVHNWNLSVLLFLISSIDKMIFCFCWIKELGLNFMSTQKRKALMFWFNNKEQL